MRLDRVPQQDLAEMQRLSKELLRSLHRANLADTILAELLDEFEQQAAKARHTRRKDGETSSTAPG